MGLARAIDDVIREHKQNGEEVQKLNNKNQPLSRFRGSVMTINWSIEDNSLLAGVMQTFHGSPKKALTEAAKAGIFVVASYEFYTEKHGYRSAWLVCDERDCSQDDVLIFYSPSATHGVTCVLGMDQYYNINSDTVDWVLPSVIDFIGPSEDIKTTRPSNKDQDGRLVGDELGMVSSYALAGAHVAGIAAIYISVSCSSTYSFFLKSEEY